jgi:hypothetical protein
MKDFCYQDACLYVSDDDEYYFEEPQYFEDKYNYDYYCYHKNFPVDWAVCHKEGTGPAQCSNCFHFGSINGVFIGYCANCAEYTYGGERGRGFIDVGVEYSKPSVLCFESAFETYLKDVDIWSILPVKNPEINGEEDIIESEDVDEGDTEIGIMTPQFEGGYNDF